MCRERRRGTEQQHVIVVRRDEGIDRHDGIAAGAIFTITGWPQRWLRRSANSRAAMSEPLPAPSVRMKRTGRVGHFVSAEAMKVTAETAISAKARANR